jgi:ketosteroid isomerase-like protein
MIPAAKALRTAEQLTRAVADGDADRLATVYAPGAVVWHSTDQVEMPFADVQNLVRAIRAVSECRVDVSATLLTERGFVQTQKNTYTFRDGRQTSFHAALVTTLDEDGRIVRLEEYLDSAGLTPLITALGPAERPTSPPRAEEPR